MVVVVKSCLRELSIFWLDRDFFVMVNVCTNSVDVVVMMILKIVIINDDEDILVKSLLK